MPSRYGLALLLLAISADASPVVVGFERNHAATPSPDGGRLLYNELQCAACHGGETALPPRTAPDLTAVTHRSSSAWIQEFLTDHHNADPTPVLHYLASLTPTPKPARPPRHVNAERGSDLYHTTGCVACHAPQPDFQPPHPTGTATTYPHVPLPDLTAKYSLTSLTSFIANPLTTRPDGRMPHFPMLPQDAVDLAGYLLDFKESDGALATGITPLKPDPTLAGRGHALAASQNCAACHTLPDLKPKPPIPITSIGAGCLTNNRYDLTPPQKASLQLYLNNPSHSPHTGLALDALNCAACHDPGPARHPYFTGDPNLGDTGRFPPPLTNIGKKLTPEWLAGVLDGTHRVRPYAHTQMPHFGTATPHLKTLLPESVPNPLPPGDPAAGQKLLGTQGGNSCITCHAWRDRPSLGIAALDLSTLADRLQPAWLKSYLIDPSHYRAGTLMPSFWPDGKAANREILNGDTDAQIASILAFAKTGKGQPEGFPDTTTRDYELIPADRPIVQRTFLKNVGTHAVLAGFPQGIHLAYNAETATPALAWKGRFFDAYTTWFSRFAPFETPLGTGTITWPKPETNARFSGYRLAPDGTPTFLSTTGDTTIQETFKPTDANTLVRTLTWQPENAPIPTITHPESTTHTTDLSPGQLTITYTWK